MSVRTTAREALVDVTEGVTAAVNDSGKADAIVTLFVPHTSAAVTINENADRDVQHDMLKWLRTLVPERADFRHAEGNSDAHIKAALVGSSVQVPLVNGRMLLGRWQGIYFFEFDGPRLRRLEVVVS
jgi:secondary thiamine-phosphate synthase enzyme